MSNRAAGQRFEKKIKDYLESIGFVVEKARASVIWIKKGPGKPTPISTHHDLFGVADMIAIHPAKKYTLFVQATRDVSDAAPRRRKLEAVPWNHEAQRVQLWMLQPGIRGGIRVEELLPATGTAAQFWRENFFKLTNGAPAPMEVL
jgi:hypothetical protein